MKIKIVKTILLIKIAVLFFAGVCLAEEGFKTTIEKSLEINQNRNQFNYLHFTFNFIPEFYEDILTDLRYEIVYNEVGTNYQKMWVNRNDGHLINLSGLGVDYQWKGPFNGLRSVRYKFRFELTHDVVSETGRAVYLSIFSTHPEIDANYFKSYYSSPFSVNAYYYDYSGLKVFLNTYNHISTIYAAYRVTRVPHPLTVIVTSALENIFILAIDSYVSKVKSIPIKIDIKCNVCGEKYSIERDTFDAFVFQCHTDGCHNTATIRFD